MDAPQNLKTKYSRHRFESIVDSLKLAWNLQSVTVWSPTYHPYGYTAFVGEGPVRLEVFDNRIYWASGDVTGLMYMIIQLPSSHTTAFISDDFPPNNLHPGQPLGDYDDTSKVQD